MEQEGTKIPARPRTSIASRLLVALVASLLCFSVAELAARVLWKSRIVLFPRFHAEARYGEFTLRRLVPHARFWHTSIDGSWEFRTNAQGFRDDQDWPLEKPAGRVRVLVLGDSHTEGFEVRQEHTYSAVMERALRARGIDAQVLNAGVSGFGTAEELAYLENEGIRYAPDAVVLGFYGNDFEDNANAGLFGLRDGAIVQLSTSHVPGVAELHVMNAIPGLAWLSQNSYFYSQLMNTVWDIAKRQLLLRAHARVETEYAVPSGVSVGEAETQLAGALIGRMHAFCRAHEIPLVILDIPVPDPLFVAPDAPIEESLGFRSSVPEPLVDVFRRQSEAFLDSDAVLGPWRGVAEIHRRHGDRHINEFAHAVLGRAAAEAVAALLAEEPSDDRVRQRRDH